MTEDRMARERAKNQETGTKRVYPEEKKIESNVPNIARLVGCEEIGKEDYQLYFRAWIVCDDGDKRPFIIENEWEGPGVLSRLLGDRTNFYAGGFLESKKDDFNKKYYIYESASPDLMTQIAYNNDRSGREGSWKGKKEYVFNCIDRELSEDKETHKMINWCAEKKHTKLLRMGPTAFDSLVDARDNDGALTGYDINYQKKGSGLQTKHTIMRAGSQLDHVINGPLSDEEKAYESYNLKDVVRLASAHYILKYLTDTIKAIDDIMGTSFYAELEKQFEVEEETWESQNTSSPNSPVENKNNQQQYDTSFNPKELEAQASVETSQTTPEEIIVQPEVAQAPRGSVRGSVKSPTNSLSCKRCGASIEETTEVCPECGTQLLAPCDNPDCRKLFSTFEYKCPHCGQEYEKTS